MARRRFDVAEATRLVEDTQLPLREVAELVGSSYGAIRVWYSKAFPEEFRKERKIANYRASKQGPKNPMHGKTGPAHHNYVGRAADQKGYYTVLRPTWWTGSARGKRVFEHHVSYCIAHGLTEIPAGMHVHHIDGDPGNNSAENLLLVTPAQHVALHRKNVSKQED